MERKLIVAMLAGNCENTIDMCIKSVFDFVDNIIIVYDTSSKDSTKDKLIDWFAKDNKKIIILEREYEHDLNVKSANSDARNYYLNYLIEHYNGQVCLVLDADEVCNEYIKELKEVVIKWDKEILFSPRMIHFIGDFGHIDATVENHIVLNRLFTINDGLYYPAGEHPVLACNKEHITIQSQPTDKFVIYHLGYIPNMNYYKERYLTHKAKSQIHSDNFLQWWFYSHITGQYPKKEIDITTIPKVIKDEFLIDDDYFYFKDRGIEYKHWLDIYYWKTFFDLGRICGTTEDEDIIIIGDGLGVRTLPAKAMGLRVLGTDINKYAVDNCYGDIKDCYIKDDIVNTKIKCGAKLIVVYDVLEHLNYQDLNQALSNINALSNQYILFSIPFIGDLNLESDSTHLIKESKEWWINKLKEHDIKILETPQHFLFKEQLIIGEVQNDK